MPALPGYPSLEYLRREAKRLLRAERSGDRQAERQILAVAPELTLSSAQLAVARSYGFPSWPQLKVEVETRALGLAEKARAFCWASIGDGTGRAVRMLSETPELAEAGFATALVLGDDERVRAQLDRDPGLASRVDSESGWTPLHLVCGSRWHWLQPRRGDGLVAVARLLLDAGARLDARSPGTRGRTPLACAAATASQGEANEPLIALLLRRGAVPNAEDLYLVGFARNAPQALQRLLAHVPDAAETASKAFASSISRGDTDGVRVLLEAGADPRRFRDDDGCPGSALHAAIASRCPVELFGLLLVHDADPNAVDEDGRSPYRAATAAGRSDITELLRAHGARDDTSLLDRLLAACLYADEAAARRELEADPALRASPAEALGAAALRAAEAGSAAAINLVLSLGFPIGARMGDFGGTLLHIAAYAGSAEVVQLLLGQGADLEARDSNWDDTPLSWAWVGSGERPGTNPKPDWPRTVQILLDAAASTDGITFSAEDPKPPSREVADILRKHASDSQESPA